MFFSFSFLLDSLTLFFCLHKFENPPQNENTVLILIVMSCDCIHFLYCGLSTVFRHVLYVLLLSQAALPVGYFSPPPSVSLMQMFSLVKKGTVHYKETPLSCISTHPRTHLFMCFLSRFYLSPPFPWVSENKVIVPVILPFGCIDSCSSMFSILHTYIFVCTHLIFYTYKKILYDFLYVSFISNFCYENKTNGWQYFTVSNHQEVLLAANLKMSHH